MRKYYFSLENVGQNPHQDTGWRWSHKFYQQKPTNKFLKIGHNWLILLKLLRSFHTQVLGKTFFLQILDNETGTDQPIFVSNWDSAFSWGFPLLQWDDILFRRLFLLGQNILNWLTNRWPSSSCRQNKNERIPTFSTVDLLFKAHQSLIFSHDILWRMLASFCNKIKGMNDISSSSV